MPKYSVTGAVHASTYAAAAFAAAYDDDDAAFCDVVRDVITIEEVCAALGVSPDEVMQ